MTTWNTGALESVACDHCQSRDTRAIITRPDGLAVHECRRCGLAYITPRPTAERVFQLYNADYYSSSLDESPQESSLKTIGYWSYLSRAETALRTKIMTQRLDWVLQMRGSASPRMLEIGCATGEFASAAHRRGVPITAIDISTDAIQMAVERYPDVNFRATGVEQLADGSERFDIVVAFEVIEHVLSPSQFLQACTRLLAPGGVLVFSTPNYRRARVLQDRWIGYHTSFAHLFFYSDESLARLGHAAGLDVLEWKTTGSGSMPPANVGGRRWLKQALTRTQLLPLIRSLRTAWQAVRHGETYEPFGSGHTLLMAFQKPLAAAQQQRFAA